MPSLTREFVEKCARHQQASRTFPLWPLPHRQHSKEGCPAPLQLNRGPKQRNMAQMKEHSKTSERELSDEEIANLSDGEFKALVIKMLTELIEFD